MKITGELLKAERLKKNYSVAEVANSLKLSSRIVVSIEAGDIDELPAKTFIRGFVKSYAQFLKLDSDLILRQFLEEMGSTQPLPKVPPPQAMSADNKPRPPKSKSTPTVPTNLDINQDSKKKTLIYASFAAVLLFVILAINNVVEKYQKESVVDGGQVAQVAQTSQVQPSMPTENAQAPLSSETVPPTEKVDESSVPASSASADISKPTPTTPETKIPVTSVEAVQPTEFEPSQGKPVELIIEARKDIEFFYAKGNTKNFVRVKLAPKQVQVIRSPTGLHLMAEDGSGLNLILNGLDKGQASTKSKPVRLTF